ncbi:hypothetical protein C0J52_09217 [Blattella germanica]|nr:hypothetical protein C0J52_09217 [Blattella germanica]
MTVSITQFRCSLTSLNFTFGMPKSVPSASDSLLESLSLFTLSTISGEKLFCYKSHFSF